MSDLSLRGAALYNLLIGFRPDWLNSLASVLPFYDHNGCARQVASFQALENIPVSGIIDARTRISLVSKYPDLLAIRMIGPHTTPGHTILDTSGTEAAIYDRLVTILKNQHHDFELPNLAAHIVAIRGCACRGDVWVRTQSAKDYVSGEYGVRMHFSADKPDYIDSLIAVIWREFGEPHVYLTAGSTSPNETWPTGTAHLCPGQYSYKIGFHRTREPDHIAAVLDMQGIWPDDWFLEVDPEMVRYAALEPTSPIEVVRSHGTALDISTDDVRDAEYAIAERTPAFVDHNLIKINIHTCAADHASSQGCQNIPPTDYTEFMSVLKRLSSLQMSMYGFPLDVTYSLIDSSYI